ncbi:hypothetical protein NDU88_009372 [Pleurodeles waltl]|uniref:Uncharacterized protein n=1 Tax=Pleurodeles waltl TaxID=8319 RepID=A0AAV7PVS5_PLEWA|nr:hypothetical protein NDU88_009372 [Pleurodeles waltl]
MLCRLHGHASESEKAAGRQDWDYDACPGRKLIMLSVCLSDLQIQTLLVFHRSVSASRPSRKDTVTGLRYILISPDQECPATFLADLRTSREAAAQELDADFTLGKIKMALVSLPTGKTPGNDGFTFDFNQAFNTEVARHLLKLEYSLHP